MNLSDIVTTDSVYGEGENAITVTLLAKPIERGLAGMARSPLFSETIPIVSDQTPRGELDYSHATLVGYDRGDGSFHPGVLMWREVFDLLKTGSPMALTMLFHELGHFVQGGLRAPKTDELRAVFVENGGVSDDELQADSFASDYLGFEVVIQGLTQLLTDNREKFDNNDYDRASYRLSTTELERRIAILSKKREGIAEKGTVSQEQ